MKLSDLQDDEIELVSTPLSEEAEKIQATQDPSMLGSAARGALSGAAYGFDDELVGATKALPSAITPSGGGLLSNVASAVSGALTSDNIKDLYKKYRDEYRDLRKEDAEVNPVSNLTGEIAGSILSPSPVSKLTGAAKVAKALPGASGAIAKSALTGAGDTVLQSAGLEERDLSSDPTDYIDAAASGLLAGGVMSGIGQAAGKLKNLPVFDPVKTIFKSASEGVDLGKELPNLRKRAEGITSNIVKQARADARTAKSAKDKLIQKADDDGKKIDISDFKDDFKNINKLPQTDKEILKRYTEGLGTRTGDNLHLSPRESEVFKSAMYDVTQNSDASSELKKYAKLMSDKVTKRQTEVISPVLPQMNKRIQDMYDFEELVTGRSGPQDARRAALSQDRGASGLLKVGEDQTLAQSPRQFERVTEGFEFGGEQYPGMRQLFPDTVENVAQEAGKVAELGRAGELLTNSSVGFRSSTTGSPSIVGNVMGAGLQAVNLAGKGVHSVKEIGNSLKGIAGKPIEEIRSRLAFSPTASEEAKNKISTILSRANSESKQRAILFQIMQDPDMRDALGIDISNNEE